MISGLTLLDTISEPMAAAIYFEHHYKKTGKLLNVDVGGMSLEVSVSLITKLDG